MDNLDPAIDESTRLRLRQELADFPEAQIALDCLDDCEGNLEDASLTLAIKAGQTPEFGDGWLTSLAKRCRVVLCSHERLRQAIADDRLSVAVALLQASDRCPSLLVLPVLLLVRNRGIETFCQSLDCVTVEP